MDATSFERHNEEHYQTCKAVDVSRMCISQFDYPDYELFSMTVLPALRSNFQKSFWWLSRYSTFLKARKKLCYEAYTIWLFTRSDLKTIVIPKSVFGVLGALSGSSLVTRANDTVQSSLARAPLVVLWVWIVLLPFDIDNQRRTEAIEEDRVNKPWRPLPSRRMTPAQAFRVMLLCHGVGIAYCLIVGGLHQKLIGIVLGWVYNELGAADRSCIGKNAINALGYVTFCMGATAVAGPGSFTTCGLYWFALTGCIVFTTVQMQDLTDVAGDAVRARRTVPLVIGGRLCRWTIAILVPFWTIAATSFWGAISIPAVLSAAIALVVSRRVVHNNDTRSDKVTFRLWNLWMVTVYMMPLARGMNH